MLEALRFAYAYNTWANQRVLAAAGRLRLQQFVASPDGQETIRDVLVHTAWAQWLWLERWQDHSPSETWPAGQFPYVATLAARWREIDSATHAFIDALGPADVDRVIRYRSASGEHWEYPLWQAMLHQVNHATQHRAEAAMLLTRAGCTPGSLDQIVFIAAGGRW